MLGGWSRQRCRPLDACSSFGAENARRLVTSVVCVDNSFRNVSYAAKRAEFRRSAHNPASMSSGSVLHSWRRLATGALASLRGARLADDDRRAFHAELALLAAERMNAFCWLLFVVHAALLVRDVTLNVAALPPRELFWSRWLFRLH